MILPHRYVNRREEIKDPAEAVIKTRIDPSVFKDLMNLAKRYDQVTVWVEKAVDVLLAVDMVTMATRDEYEAAYLLSADGDFTGAVQFVRGFKNKKVYAACPSSGAQLGRVVNSFIPLGPDWFEDCYK